MIKKVTKALFPVAGLGTRFLPVTKASPKEMLPIVDKPLIQYAVEEAVEAGITDLIFVTGRNKRAIEDHFDKAYELENELLLANKIKLLEIVKNIIPQGINCIFIRQAEALGLGHAVLCSKSLLENDSFAVILADELIDGVPGSLSQLLSVYNETGTSVIGLQEISIQNSSSFGMVKLTDKHSKYSKIEYIIEKPNVENSPSNIAVIGRYILTPTIFDQLSNLNIGVNGEIQLSDAIQKLLSIEDVLGLIIDGERYDCGSKLGYLKATVNYGLRHEETGDLFRDFLNGLIL